MDDIDRQTVINTDGPLLWTGRFFWFFGVIELLLAIAVPVYSLYNARAAADAMAWLPAIGVSVAGCFGFGLHAIMNLVAATGLGRGSKLGWYLATFLTVFYVPNCTFFLAIFFLYALMRAKVRTAYLG